MNRASQGAGAPVNADLRPEPGRVIARPNDYGLGSEWSGPRPKLGEAGLLSASLATGPEPAAC